jgi:hypothetical protein
MKKVTIAVLALFFSACSAPNASVPSGAVSTTTGSETGPQQVRPGTANQYIYAGCGVFSAGDIFSHDVSGYTKDLNTGGQFSGAPAGTFAYGDDQTAETVTAEASSTLTTFTVRAQPGGHVPPLDNSSTMPFSFFAAQNIEGGDNGGYPNNQWPITDGHAVVLETDTCAEYETFGTSFNLVLPEPLAAYSGRENDLSDTWKSQVINGNAVTAAGIPLLPTTYWGEDAATTTGKPYINHIGSFLVKLDASGNTNCVSQYGYAFPATAAGGHHDDSNCPWPMHMGDLYELKGGFDCTPYVPSVAKLCNSMKKYPIVLDDFIGYSTTSTGVCCAIRFGQSANRSATPWPYNGTGGLGSFLGALSLSASIFTHMEPPNYAVLCMGTSTCLARKSHARGIGTVSRK